MAADTTDPTLADNHPGRAAPHDRSRLRAAVSAARRTLPPATGELVARELLAVDELNLAMPRNALIPRVVAEVLALPAYGAQDGFAGKPRVHPKVPGA